MPDSFASDADLVSGCIEGRREAWDAFVARYAKLVHWSVRRTLERTAFAARPDVAEDVFQDVFRKLLEKGRLATLRDAGSVKKFLVVLASHEALDKVKSLSRRQAKDRIELDAEDESGEAAAALQAAASPRTPAEEAAIRERETLVGQMLESLPSRDRLCLELHYLEGKTHREIASFLGVPQDTVSTVIRRAREKLKQRFPELEGAE